MKYLIEIFSKWHPKNVQCRISGQFNVIEEEGIVVLKVLVRRVGFLRH